MFYAWYEAPFTRLLLAGTDQGLKFLLFADGRHAPRDIPESWQHSPDELCEPLRQLDAWFAGELHEFDVRLAAEGTPFQQKVWDALLSIPYGETRTYGEVAAAIGQPTASRAVGAANGRNPISIIVPCHRVIGSSGKLVGFGGGVDVKRALLEHERTHAEQSQPALF